MFFVICDYVTVIVTVNYVWQFVIVMCDIMLNPNSKSKIRKENKKENKNKNSLLFSILILEL